MHWKNSDFQNAFFIAGKSHTPDEAWRMLKQQHEDRDLAVKVAQAGLLKKQSKLNKLKRNLFFAKIFFMINWRMEIEADLLEIKAHEEMEQSCFDAAVHERDMLQKMMDALEPERKYSHLSPAEAAQASQREYWLHELVNRAENYLITNGSIPPEHFATMRSHPDYRAIIAPEVEKLFVAVRTGNLSLGSASQLGDNVLLPIQKANLLLGPGQE